ncbi:hypothetical protein COLO4_00812 [Corchorus olitorius]|uniref:Uncharacterized protein n=1 Tax=Corchorus olitorius TaxID=93759 RepID=A0A1R3L1Q4_9ROSI|nr:hypothetical protein COLO4_01968 [Corchorus olitorius]OMP13852.1 hypothetical protein COLO4_00812 [Corchorus olitorius]
MDNASVMVGIARLVEQRTENPHDQFKSGS